MSSIEHNHFKYFLARFFTKKSRISAIFKPNAPCVPLILGSMVALIWTTNRCMAGANNHSSTQISKKISGNFNSPQAFEQARDKARAEVYQAQSAEQARRLRKLDAQQELENKKAQSKIGEALKSIEKHGKEKKAAKLNRAKEGKAASTPEKNSIRDNIKTQAKPMSEYSTPNQGKSSGFGAPSTPPPNSEVEHRKDAVDEIEFPGAPKPKK